jgi:hypothetical protein
VQENRLVEADGAIGEECRAQAREAFRRRHDFGQCLAGVDARELVLAGDHRRFGLRAALREIERELRHPRAIRQRAERRADGVPEFVVHQQRERVAVAPHAHAIGNAAEEKRAAGRAVE